MLLKNTGTKGSVPMTGTPDVSVTTSGAQAGTAGCTPASQPKPKLTHNNLSTRNGMQATYAHHICHLNF